ncbi:hypothetical protein Tco_1194781 [Tanacetum coccineum]
MVRRLLAGVGDDVFGGDDDGEVVVLVLVTVSGWCRRCGLAVVAATGRKILAARVGGGSPEIMAPTMTTHNAGRRTASTRGGRTGGQTGRGGGRTGEQTSRVGGRTCDLGGRDLLPTIVAQVGDRVSNQGNIGNQNDNAADDNIPEDDRNVNIGNGRNGCSYKDFVACKPKQFDGKGGAILYRVYGDDFMRYGMI